MEETKTKHKFQDGERVKCIATESQLKEIGLSKSVLDEELIVESCGYGGMGKKFDNELIYLVSNIYIPESFLSSLTESK